MRAIPLVRSWVFAVTATLVMVMSTLGQVAVGVSVNFGPPDLPVYEQPVCPGDGYLWTPGYWAWDGDDYYWVPGTWVLAPQPGFFWTPGYWHWGGGGFLFTEGYWGPVVGFYGGINYGFGYFGHGYEGGRWDHDHFFYNRSVNNVNITEIHNTYNTTIVNRSETRVSYNGGNGGINARPTGEEEAAARERHIAPVAAQMQHEQAARSNQQLRASVNHGRPPIAATPRPAGFNERGVVQAREGGALHNPGGPGGPSGGNNASRPPTHASEIPRSDRPPAPNTGNPKLDQKYQQQQQKLYQKQDQERQRLQQQQEQEHQRVQQQQARQQQQANQARQQQAQQANQARQQQMEQRHQQQTQQLMQRHQQQQQQMQQRQAPPPQQHSGPPPKGRP